jgi:class 3 adenylate cyclase
MSDANKMNRTWLCSVLFLDIVKYSSQSVDLQLRWKERFNLYLAKSIKDIPEDERVILDTGDGAAACFLGAPEVAMFAALDLWHSMLLDERDQQPPFRMRIGINLGPVKLVRDINGAPNALGDGINAGQRIMSFAGENQILVSQSYFEVVSRLSDDYKNLFTLKGIEKDKHIREHTVYHLSPPGAQHAPVGSEPVPEDSSVTPVPPPVQTAIPVRPAPLPVPVPEKAVQKEKAPEVPAAAKPGSNRMIPILVGVIAVVLIAAAAVWHFSSSAAPAPSNTPAPASSNTPAPVAHQDPIPPAAPPATPQPTPIPEAVLQPAPAAKPAPVVAKPASASSAPPAAVAPGLSPEDQATARDLRQRYNIDVGRAATARGNADEMRQHLSAKGMSLNAQTAASVDRLQGLLDEAADEIREHKWDDALSSLQAVEATADKINKTTGN